MLISEKIIHNNPLGPKFYYCYRYVLDVLVYFIGTVRQLKSLEYFMHMSSPNITFTTKLEHNNSMGFLNLKTSRINERLVSSIFHKPSHI